MESQVVKNLTVDAKLFLHLVLLRAGTFRHQNFFAARKATIKIWVTLRRQEGSHETSYSYPESYAFSKPNRTFHRRSGQPSARKKERMAKYARRRRGAAASANAATAKARSCLDRGRRSPAPSNATTTEARRGLDRGRCPTASANPTATKVHWGSVTRPGGKRARVLRSPENSDTFICPT